MSFNISDFNSDIFDKLSLEYVRDTNPRYRCRGIAGYTNVKDYIQPLDLILFSGNDLISRAIRIISDIHSGYGKYSHCGIVINREILPFLTELDPNKLYILESVMSSDWMPATDGVPDINGEYKLGVQIRELSETIFSYNRVNAIQKYNNDYSEDRALSAITWVPINNSPWRLITGNVLQLDHPSSCSSLKDINPEIPIKVVRQALPPNMRIRTKSEVRRRMKLIYEKYGDAPYDFFQLIYSITPYKIHPLIRKLKFPIRCASNKLVDDIISGEYTIVSRFTNLLDKDAQFCSELVANIYQEMELISPNIQAYKFIPVEFITGLRNRPDAVKLDTPIAVDITNQ